jgi:gamma-glutamyltranspeptidase
MGNELQFLNWLDKVSIATFQSSSAVHAKIEGMKLMLAQRVKLVSLPPLPFFFVIQKLYCKILSFFFPFFFLQGDSEKTYNSQMDQTVSGLVDSEFADSFLAVFKESSTMVNLNDYLQGSRSEVGSKAGSSIVVVDQDRLMVSLSESVGHFHLNCLDLS